jgi:hypothetical protein
VGPLFVALETKKQETKTNLNDQKKSSLSPSLLLAAGVALLSVALSSRFGGPFIL